MYIGLCHWLPNVMNHFLSANRATLQPIALSAVKPTVVLNRRVVVLNGLSTVLTNWFDLEGLVKGLRRVFPRRHRFLPKVVQGPVWIFFPSNTKTVDDEAAYGLPVPHLNNYTQTHTYIHSYITLALY